MPSSSGVRPDPLYPHSPSQIRVKVTRDGVEEAEGLELKLTEYLSRFSQAHDSFMTIFMELLTHGKVIVDSGGGAERLELESSSDLLDSAQAAGLLYDFTKSMSSLFQSKNKRTTRRILLPELTKQRVEPKPSAFQENDRVLFRDTNCLGIVTTVFRHHSGLPAYFVRWESRPDAPPEGKAYFTTDLIPLKSVRTVVMEPVMALS